MLDVRIVNVDHYMATPVRGFDTVYSDFRGSSVSQVPVIRIFGTTSSGKKTCVHIHGVFPYIYVPFDGESDPGQQMYQLAASLDKALNIALGTANSARQHVYKVIHVKGVPFYGYHEKSHQFLKIYFYNPLIVKKATDLLQNGAVCNKIFQCHEAHLPFILQFFIDYNLHGMSFIQLASVDFRQEPGTLRTNLESDLRPVKTTYCELEADALASDILNRKSVSDGEVANPGLAGIWNEERLRNDVSQLSQNQSQERPAAKKTLSEVLLRQRLREALAELSGRITGGSGSSVLYPAESTAGDHVHDASLVEGLCNRCTNHDVSTFMVHLDDSVIDEQLVLSLSQAPVDSQDLSLLDMMQSLAERGAEIEEGDEWMPTTQKSTETLLSQSFHCSNMEADSILGAAPNAVEEEECPQQSGLDDSADETAEKDDCWQDSIWNGLDIPQLDGAPDECSDEDNGRGTTTTSRRRQTTLGKKKPIKQPDSTIKNPSRVSSPIVIDSSEDDCYMECTPMNIFNQERYWCDKKENADSELENLVFEDTIAPVQSLKLNMFDEPLKSDMFDEPSDSTNAGNVNPTYANVLMHGDPSLTSLVEASSDDFATANGCNHEKGGSEDTGLDASFRLELLEKSSLSSQETGVELEDDSDEIVTSSQFIFDFDYEYLDDQADEKREETAEVVGKRKLRKRDKRNFEDHVAKKVNENKSKRRKDRASYKEEQTECFEVESGGANENKSKPNTGKRKKDPVKDDQKKAVESEGNQLEQDVVELNNNEKKSGNNREKSGDDEKMLASLGDEKCRNFDASVSFEETPKKISVQEGGVESKESTNKKLKKARRSGEKVRKNSENGSGDNSEKGTSSKKLDNGNEESPSKKQKKADTESPTPSKKQKKADKESPTPSKKQKKADKESPTPSKKQKKADNESPTPSKKQKKAQRSGGNVGENSSVTMINKNSPIDTSTDHDDDDLFRINLKLNTNRGNDLTSTDHDVDDDDLFRINFKLGTNKGNDLSPKIPNKPKPKSPSKGYPSQAYTSLISTEPTGQNDAKLLFPCYFIKKNGVVMKFKFPFKQDNLSEKTKQRYLDRRKKFASILLPTVDYNIQLSNIEDDYLSKELVEGYYENHNSSDLSEVQNGSPTPKKMKKSESNSLKNIKESSNSTSKPGVNCNDKRVTPKQVLSPKLRGVSDREESVANSSVSSPKISKIRKSLDFGLENEANGVELLQKKPSQKLTNSHDVLELSETDINTPKKSKSLNTPTGSSSQKKSTAKKAGKKAVLKKLVVRKLESPHKTDKQSMSTPLKRSPNKAAKTSPKSIENKNFEKYIRMYDIKPCRVVMDKSPENLTVEKTCSKEQNNPNESKLSPENLENSTVKKVCSNEQNSPVQSKLSPEIIIYLNKACSKEQNNPVRSELSTGNFNKVTVKNVCSKVQKNPDQSKLPTGNFNKLTEKNVCSKVQKNPVESKLSTENFNNLTVKPTCSKEQNNPVHSRLSHENSNTLTVKTTRSKELKNSVSKLPHCSTSCDLNQVMECDNLLVPFSELKVPDSKPDMQDFENISTLVREHSIEFKLSVRLDRIDQSMFVKTDQKHMSFKIDNLDGSFGEDIDSSSDDDVPITPAARRISGCKKTNQRAKRGQSSTPRPRYRPLKVKITKSPPKKVTKPLPPCWVLLKKLNFDKDKGSSVDSLANSSNCLGVEPKNPNPVDDEPSPSQCALSVSDDYDIFGEVPYLPEPKTALNLEGEDDECEVFREVLSQPEPKNEEVKVGVNSEDCNIFGEVLSQPERKHSEVEFGVNSEDCNIFGEVLSQPERKHSEVKFGVNSDDCNVFGEVLSQPERKHSEVKLGVNSEDCNIFGEVLSQPERKHSEVKFGVNSDDCNVFGEFLSQPERKHSEVKVGVNSEDCNVFGEVLSQPERKHSEVKFGVNSDDCNIFGEVLSQPERKHSEVKFGVDSDDCNIFGEVLSQPQPKHSKVKFGVDSDDCNIFGEVLSQPQPKHSKVKFGVNSENCNIFGEVLSQPKQKNRVVNVGVNGEDSKSSTKFDLTTSPETEHNLETLGSVVSDELSQNAFENSVEKSSPHNRSTPPVAALKSENKNPVFNYMSTPGPSTSSAPPWCHSDSYSSSDEKEDKGILSFYNTSVYFPENDGSDSDRTIYEIFSLDEECSEVSGEEFKTFIPKIPPPTYNEILTSLPKYGLTEVLNVEPFCSDVSDRASTEVGPVSLKLKSRSAIDLEEYDGVFSKGLCMYRNNLLKSLETKKSSVLAGDRKVVLVPLKGPPSCEQVRRWLKVKAQLEKETKKEEDKCKKLERLIVPCSPGQNCGSDDEQNTLVLTPMSPPSRTHSTPSDYPPGGTLSLEDTPLCTPVPPAPNRRNKRKSSDILKKSSAKLLKDYAAMSSIDENEGESVISQKDDNKLQLSDNSICISEETRENIEAQLKKKARLSSSFQIEAGNSDSTSGLPARIDNLQKTRPQIQHQYLTLMILELHVQTRGDLLPDPENDPIRAVFYHIINDVPEESDMPTTLTGIIAVGDLVPEDQTVSVTCVSDEMALLVALVELIRKWDPEMFIGYEIEKLSWGYLIERAYTLGMNLNMELSRVRGAEGGGASKYEDEVGGDSDIRLAGRIVLNVWRLLRSEVALQSYTFENIMYHVLRRRIPLFSFRALSTWWEHRTQLYRWMTVDHYLVRVRGVAEILDHLDLIGRTSELARLFGIQFYEVLSRGSQFRVESMMLRMAKPENYVAVSPTTRQRAHMRAPESLPLIMEPESRFYSDPVIVLDFQSLYPSIIIAYNYCFSTCLGRVESLAKSELFDFGCTHLRVPFSTVKKLEENLNISPCGVAFVNSSVRKGVLPRMLQEILETRLMVKRSMKKNKKNKALHKVLHNRQLGLKLIANVTYGYTSANFSGRMPCIEIGDSVVSKGRETLERAIAMVQNTQRWSARVVYGDTDSLFVAVPGRTRADAFRIGAEIADAVTADNPRPVKLKLEKVYQPCILQTKKRYVGHMWESADQETPTYDAKGIETVRRDGCPAVAKILQKSLQLLFETKDVSIVKRYILHQFGKVSSGRISIQELTFAREYRGARGYKPGACVPALELARSWMKKDRRSEPRTGERVPYVIVSGPPGLPLIRLVRSPRELLADPALKVNADYYISRVIIPPLNRCLLLLGANVHNWYTSMPRRQAPSLPSALPSGVKKATISQYFATVSCAVCHDQSCTSGVCDRCRVRPQTVAVSLAAQLHGWERRRHLVLRVCQSCCGRSSDMDCTSLDCPVLYARADAERQLAHEPVFRKLQEEYFNCDF